MHQHFVVYRTMMDSRTRLDYALFQLTPTRTRYMNLILCFLFIWTHGKNRKWSFLFLHVGHKNISKFKTNNVDIFLNLSRKWRILDSLRQNIRWLEWIKICRFKGSSHILVADPYIYVILSHLMFSFSFLHFDIRNGRCDLVICAGDCKEKLASGLLEPFVAHLEYAKDQVSKGGYSIKLSAPDSAFWFTKSTLERSNRYSGCTWPLDCNAF